MDDAMVPAMSSVQRLARIAGLLYLVLAVCGMFAPIVLQSLVVQGDAAATAHNIMGSLGLFRASLVAWIVIVAADVAIAVAFYILLEPVSRALSLVAAAFRLVYATMLGAFLLHLYGAFLLLTGADRAAGPDREHVQTQVLSALDTFNAGFLLALVFFGVHLLALGYLLHRSRYVPRAFGVLLVGAGVGYIVDSLARFFVADYPRFATAILLAPAVLGEFGLTGWLLVKGMDVRGPTASEAG